MPSQKIKILIVEDDPFLEKAYRIKFEQEGFQVVMAPNGALALDLAKKETPLLVILDLMLPKMNGFDVLEKIKKDEDLKGIPVIILSVLGQKVDKEKAKELGASEYLVKTDYSLEEIIKKVKDYSTKLTINK